MPAPLSLLAKIGPRNLLHNVDQQPKPNSGVYKLRRHTQAPNKLKSNSLNIDQIKSDPPKLGTMICNRRFHFMINSLGKISALSVEQLTSPGSYHFEYDHFADYLPSPTTIKLHVLMFIDAQTCHATISAAPFPEATFASAEELTQYAAKYNARVICLTSPLPLQPVYIPKPWGQEIWFSGIEKRGVSTVNNISIAWLLDVFGGRLGCKKAPMLLKILDPHPEPNLGDLYFEMHEEKVEVYVVTQVDPTAWPAGIGQIRYGFNQHRLTESESRDHFLADYLSAVNLYKECRTEIDDYLQQLRSKEGLAQDETLTPKAYHQLLKQVPTELLDSEEIRREAMYAFTSITEISEGDVVTVRPLVPHSLQHGVRVVEFQTPHYERYILSFGQKVMTQANWDTQAAIKDAVIETAVIEDLQPTSIEPLAEGQTLIADFPEFRVLRIDLGPGQHMATQHQGYTMIIGITGDTEILETNVASEDAFYLSPRLEHRFLNATSKPSSLLIAEEIN
jgi:hypothetical protein